MQTKNIHEIYKCSVCGNIVEVTTVGGGELICCGKPMDLLEEKTSSDEEGIMEKHVPVIEELPANVCSDKDGVTITVGSIEHPMTEEHYIEWIEVILSDGRRGKKFLKPGDKPQVIFQTRQEVIGARAYCNLHGLWKK